jgi:transcriptional regulator with XRE-family HTH domain
MNYGEMILKYLDSFNMTQKELAKKSKISPSTLNDVISGRVKKPSYNVLAKIADGLGINVSILTNEKNDNLLPEYVQIAKECQDEGVDPDLLLKIKDMITKKNK